MKYRIENTRNLRVTVTLSYGSETFHPKEIRGGDRALELSEIDVSRIRSCKCLVSPVDSALPNREPSTTAETPKTTPVVIAPPKATRKARKPQLRMSKALPVKAAAPAPVTVPNLDMNLDEEEHPSLPEDLTN
jgi:hypothetical protein